MDNNIVQKIFWGGCAATAGAYGYGVYRLSKLDEHINHEGLYVVGGLLGGAYAALMGSGFSGLSDSAAPKHVPLEIVGSTAFLGSISYVVCRNLAKRNPKQSLLISAVIGLAASAALFHQDLGIGKAVAVKPSGKDSVGASTPIQTTK